MSSTLLNGMEAYMCKGENDMIYALITNTAESNLHPIRYHRWPIAAGRKYQMVKMICDMAADVYSGMLKWHGGRGRDGSSSEFVTYGENLLKLAVETPDPIPDIDHYNIIYFRNDDPCTDIFANFERIGGFKIRNFYSEKVLVKEHPTVLDLEIAFRIREHYQSSLKYAEKDESIDVKKLRKNLYDNSYMFPAEFRNAWNSG